MMLLQQYTISGFTFYLKKYFRTELGTEGFKHFLETHVMKQVVARQISKAASCGGIMSRRKKKKDAH
jgi:penicillin amidase